MQVRNAVPIIVLYPSDLIDQSKQDALKTLVISDFKDGVQEECTREDVAVIIYEDESKIRKILAYNTELLDEQASTSYEVANQCTWESVEASRH